MKTYQKMSPHTPGCERGEDWRDQAACRDHDPEIFHPVGTSGPALLQTARAKAICSTCPVIAPCLLAALDRGEQGVWGETSEEERANLARHLPRRAPALPAVPAARAGAR